MAGIAFLNIPAAGHVNPSLGVVAELVRRGHHVVCYNGEAFRTSAERAGAEFRAYPPLPQYDALTAQMGRGNFAYNALALMSIGEFLLPRVLEDMQRDRSDLIVHDSLASWGQWAADILKIPSASSITTFVLLPGMMPRIPPPRMAGMLLNVAKAAPRFLRARSRLKARGIAKAGLTDALMSLSPLNIVYTSRAIQPKSERMQDGFVFVGASLEERRDALDIALDGRPLIYVSLGTLHVADSAFYRMVYAAFGDLPVQVVVSTGQSAVEQAVRDAAPGNVTLRPFVAQLEILKRAAAFVTHGGLNSVHEGFFFGVPLVVMPQHLEQQMVADQVERLYAGVVLTRYGDPAVMRAAVERVTADPAFRQRSAALGESLRTAGGAAAAADAIEAYLSRAT